MLSFCNNNNTEILVKNSIIFLTVYRKDTFLQVAYHTDFSLFDFLESMSQNGIIILTKV